LSPHLSIVLDDGDAVYGLGGEAVQLLYGEHDETLDLLLHAGLAIKTHPKKPTQKNPKKNHPKKPKKTHLKKPTKNCFFLGFFKFLIFYENNTKFSL
jgi:hypothetical protein